MSARVEVTANAQYQLYNFRNRNCAYLCNNLRNLFSICRGIFDRRFAARTRIVRYGEMRLTRMMKIFRKSVNLSEGGLVLQPITIRLSVFR